MAWLQMNLERESKEGVKPRIEGQLPKQRDCF